MKHEPARADDSFINELRDSGTVENTLVSRFGLYKASEVDAYITHLQDQVQGIESVYQDRFEELRTSLLGMTRERDDKIAKLRDLEARLEVSQNLDQALAERGLVALPSLELDALRQENQQLTQKIDQLLVNISENTDKVLIIEDLHRTEAQLEARTSAVSALEQELTLNLTRLSDLQATVDDQAVQIGQLTSDRDKAIEKFTALSESYSTLDESLQNRSKEVNELKVRNTALENNKQELIQEINTLRDRCQAKTEEANQVEQRLAAQQQAAAQFQLQLDTLNLQLGNLTDTLAQSRSQYQLLEAQYQIGQDLVNRLMIEKSSLENEIKNQKQRWELQREAMTTRFQSVLNSQNEFLKKLQENFDASVRYMENLTETGLRGFGEEDR